MIFCFYLFDRDGVCLYYEDWNRTRKPKSLPGLCARPFARWTARLQPAVSIAPCVHCPDD